MPLGCNPDMTTPYSLRSDGGIPEARRPQFLIRFSSPRRMAEIEQLITAATADANLADDPAADHAARMAKIIAAIGMGVAGWRRMVDEGGNPLPDDAFSHALLADLLSTVELVDLARACVDVPRAKEMDFFASGWPWESRVAKGPTAGDAAIAVTATTDGQPTIPSTSSAPVVTGNGPIGETSSTESPSHAASAEVGEP